MMMTAALIIGIILISGLARLYVNHKYDVGQEKKDIKDALRRNNKAREKNASLSIRT